MQDDSFVECCIGYCVTRGPGRWDYGSGGRELFEFFLLVPVFLILFPVFFILVVAVIGNLAAQC